jgi:hypothetical protein
MMASTCLWILGFIHRDMNLLVMPVWRWNEIETQNAMISLLLKVIYQQFENKLRLSGTISFKAGNGDWIK